MASNRTQRTNIPHITASLAKFAFGTHDGQHAFLIEWCRLEKHLCWRQALPTITRIDVDAFCAL